MQTLAQDTELDVRRLPVEKDLKGSKGLGIFLILFSSVWGGVPSFILLKSILDGDFEAGMLFMIVFSMAGLALFLFGLNQFFKKGSIRITAKEVTLQKSGLFGERHWTEPVENYEGLLYRSEYHSGGKNRPSYTLYIIELYHDDEGRKVVLHETKSDQGVRSLWEEFCRAMSLPALEEAEGGMIQRNAEDLDKSVRQLVEEEKITIDFDPAKSPPAGLSLSVDDDRLNVTIEKKGFNLIGLVILFLFPGAFIYLGFFLEDGSVFIGSAGIFFGLLFLGVCVWLLITKPLIRLSREGVHILRITPWGETTGVRIPAEEIEQVYIKKRENSHTKGVYISSDRQQKYVGEGLDDEGLEWLRNCVLTVVSAPQK